VEEALAEPADEAPEGAAADDPPEDVDEAESPDDVDEPESPDDVDEPLLLAAVELVELFEARESVL
jgi:hypothetical protein